MKFHPIFPTLFVFLPLVVLLTTAAALPQDSGKSNTVAVPATDVNRSPTDLALTPDGKFALTANRKSDTATLVDLTADKIVSEIPVGKEPFGVAISPDGKTGIVTDWHDGTITLMSITASGLTRIGADIPVGSQPRGVVFAPNGKRAYIALSDEDAVAIVDMTAKKTVGKLNVETEPWHLAITPDGKRLAVGNARGQTVTVLSTVTGKSHYNTTVYGRNLRHLAVSPDGKWAYMTIVTERGAPATQVNIDKGWVIGNRLVRVPLDVDGQREVISLDPQGKAFGDLDGVTVSPDEKSVAITAGGTGELILLSGDLPWVDYGGSGDFIDNNLRTDSRRFRRIALGGRPLGATFTPDGKRIVVANYFDNSVQTVDFLSGKIVSSIGLGGSKLPDLARRGEMIFCDARRSFHQWYSCNSCHVEGHTNGGSYDTFNDGAYGQTKKTISLRRVAYTAPYTWHGWQKTLHGAVRESLIRTMQGETPSDDDVNAVEAYLNTLDLPPNPNRSSISAASLAKGASLFQAKGCNNCHGGTEYTLPIVTTVGLELPSDVYKGYNPPSLRGVYNRAPYLHDGRASTLEDVLTRYHRPSQLVGKPDCNPTELKDLVAYLKTL